MKHRWSGQADYCSHRSLYVYIDKNTESQKEESNWHQCLLQKKHRFVNKSNTAWPSRNEKSKDTSPGNPFSRQGGWSWEKNAESSIRCKHTITGFSSTCWEGLWWSIATRSGRGGLTLGLLNPLKTKHRLLYLKTQFVPRSKHFSSRL